MNNTFRNLLFLLFSLMTVGCASSVPLSQTPAEFYAHQEPTKFELEQAIADYHAQRYTQAYPSLSKLANSPHLDALAMFYLGEMYLHGRGVSPSVFRAKEYYKQAFQALLSPARQGYPQHQYALGLSYLAGKGTKSDHRIGTKWLKKAADQNFTLAQVEYGRYLKKQGRNPIQFFISAAKSNDPVAQALLAQEYFSGKYTATNPNLTAKWLKKAAKNNYPPAQHKLAVLYTKGVGVSKSPSKAVYWYELAASNGSSRSFYALGNAYQRGYGVTPDIIKAYAFYAIGIYINRYHLPEKNLNTDALQKLSLSYNQQLEAKALTKLYINALYAPTTSPPPIAVQTE